MVDSSGGTSGSGKIVLLEGTRCSPIRGRAFPVPIHDRIPEDPGERRATGEWYLPRFADFLACRAASNLADSPRSGARVSTLSGPYQADCGRRPFPRLSCEIDATAE